MEQQYNPIVSIKNEIAASPNKVAEIMMQWLTTNATYHNIRITAAAKAEDATVTVNFSAPPATGCSSENILCTAEISLTQVTIEQSRKMASNYVWVCFRSHLAMTIGNIKEI